MMKPVVSVVIPAYNRAAVLSRAVNSVLTQTYQDFEIVIVDDCSNDNTAEIVKTFHDPCIRYIKHEQNKGGNAARNTGIKAAVGEFVAFLDSDDEWLPVKLEKQMLLFLRPEIGLVYCGLCFVELGAGESDKWFVKCTKDFREDLLVSNFIGTTSAAVVRLALLRKIAGFDESLKSCQDWDLYLRLRDICEFGYADDFLVRYHIDRKGKKQISTNPEAVVSGQKKIEQKFSKEIAQLPISKKLARIDWLLSTYLGVANFRGISLAGDGFLLSGRVKYLLVVVKIIVKSCVRKLGLR